MDEVNIVEYDPRWQTLFAQEAERIWQALVPQGGSQKSCSLGFCTILNGMFIYAPDVLVSGC